MKTVLILVVVLMLAVVVYAQEGMQPAFTLHPYTGDLQVSALGTDLSGGVLDIWVDGQWFAQVSMPDMYSGDVVTLAIIPNAATVQTWSISGAYSYTWGNGGVWQPTPDLPNDPPPDVQLPTLEASPTLAPPPPVYVPTPAPVPTLTFAGERLYEKLFG